MPGTQWRTRGLSLTGRGKCPAPTDRPTVALFQCAARHPKSSTECATQDPESSILPKSYTCDATTLENPPKWNSASRSGWAHRGKFFAGKQAVAEDPHSFAIYSGSTGLRKPCARSGSTSERRVPVRLHAQTSGPSRLADARSACVQRPREKTALL
jgi:hypothetical protein